MTDKKEEPKQEQKPLWSHLCPITQNREYTRADKCRYCARNRPESGDRDFSHTF